MMERDTRAVVEGFTKAWAKPRLETLIALLHPEVLLRQPVTPPIHGRDAARAEFARLLHWLPDLHGRVDRSAVDGDTALIAWRLRFPLRGGAHEVSIVDRLVVERGLIREREAYFDSLALVAMLLRRPREWAGYLRYRGFLPGG